MALSNAVEETTFSLSSETPRPRERRRDQRQMTILRVGTLHIAGRRELCLIRNISAGGLMAHIYSPVTLDERVSVELKTNHRVEGSIAWIEEANVGISFDAPIDLEDMLASHGQLENGWRPRLPRVEVDRLATLRVGAAVYGVSTRDISQGGVKIEIDAAVEAGQEVVLTLDKLRAVPGVVRWSHEGLCGIAFNQVIPFRELMTWLRGN